MSSTTVKHLQKGKRGSGGINLLKDYANDLLCWQCKQLIDHGVHCVRLTLPPPQPQLVANSANVDSSHYYHIDCFTCAECRQIFVDLKAYQHCVDKTNPANYSLFCLRHFVEIYKPRCPYCDKLILDEECTEAEGKAWHIGHFCCTECKRSLGGKQYIMAGGEKSKQQPDFDSKPKQQLPYCLTCFDILFGELCEECGDLIGCEVGAIIHEGRSWHASDVCFRCSLCLKSLLGKPFLPAMDGRIYCSVTCSQAMISHQKERLRRQNKLQTLHSVKKSTQPSSSSSLNNEKPTQSNGIVPETTATSNMANNLEKIAKSREEFLRSMTLDSSKPVENGDQKLKVFNLTQAGNYEEFIKKNNQCFTSKYDWSREQEFLNVIDASNCELSSLTTTTTTTGSDQNSEDNFHFALSNITGSLDRNFRSMNKPLLAKFPEINFGDLRQREEENQLVDDLNIHNLKLSHTSGTVAVVGQTSQESKFPPVVNNTRFEESKSSSLNSPSSSTGTAPIWTVSPPPEYYRVNGNDFDNSSQSSQQQDLARDKQKINGILKVNGQVKSTINYQEENDGYCSVVMDRAGQSVLTNGQYPFHSTPVTVVASGQVAKSNCKSVSFDPTIEEKDESKPRPIRRIHSRPFDYEDCSDSHSCSSCSTCSSSTDDDDDDDDYEYNLTNFNTTDYASVNQRNQIKRSQANNEACTIS